METQGETASAEPRRDAWAEANQAANCFQTSGFQRNEEMNFYCLSHQPGVLWYSSPSKHAWALLRNDIRAGVLEEVFV